jgi:hypothetical protein
MGLVYMSMAKVSIVDKKSFIDYTWRAKDWANAPLKQRFRNDIQGFVA